RIPVAVTVPAAKTEALDWVLDKLSAKPKGDPSVFPPQEDFSSTRKTELGLWHDWVKSNKDPEKFVPLWKSHQRLINNAVGKFPGVEINKAALTGHATELYYDALESWDPNRKGGAALHTHVFNHLRGLRRYVVKLQNTAKITEPWSEKITPFRTARAELTEKLGFDPPLHKIVEYTHSKDWKGTKLSQRDALEVSKYVRRGLDIHAGGEDVEGAGTHSNDPSLQAAHLI